MVPSGSPNCDSNMRHNLGLRNELQIDISWQRSAVQISTFQKLVDLICKLYSKQMTLVSQPRMIESHLDFITQCAPSMTKEESENVANQVIIKQGHLKYLFRSCK